MKTLEDLLAQDVRHPFECHVRGKDAYTFFERAWLGIKLIFGARIHYHFCNTLKVSLLSDKSFNGMEHLASFASLVICVGEPVLADAEKLDPETHRAVTQIKVTKILD